MKYKIVLDEQSLNNLILYLERVPLTGTKEAVALAIIVQAIQKAEKEGD